jgi:hypothetical protein
MNAGECRSRSGNTLTPAQEFTAGGSFRRLKMLHLARTEGEMRKEMDIDTEQQKGISGAGDSAAKTECCHEGEAYERLLQVVEPYWPDLLRQGGIYDRLDRSGTPTYVLKFRERFSGAGDGRQRTIYVGKRRDVAEYLMREIWRRREQAGTRIPPVEYQSGRESQHERPIADLLALLGDSSLAPSRGAEIERLVGLERKLVEGGRMKPRT